MPNDTTNTTDTTDTTEPAPAVIERLERSAAEAERRAGEALAKAAAAVGAQQRARQSRLNAFDREIALGYDRGAAVDTLAAALAAVDVAVAEDRDPILAWRDYRAAVARRNAMHREATEAAGRLRLQGTPVPDRIGPAFPPEDPNPVPELTRAVERVAARMVAAEVAELHRALEAAGDGDG